jgi:DNA-binding transcriptional MerR regulator
MDSGFTSAQVVKFTGITLRQLQWWDERGMVVPRREGHRRLYSMEDLAEVAVICELRQRGFSLQRVRKVMSFLQRELGKRLYESASTNSQIHLLTDGKNIFIKDSPESIVDVLKNSRQPILAVCLSDTVQRIQAGIRVDKRERPSADINVAKVRAGSRSEKHLAVGKPRLSRVSGE